MKLPALKDLSLTASHTFIRFPFAVLCALVGTIMGFVLVGLPYDSKELASQLTTGMLTMYLGMLAGIACTVFCERYFFRSKTRPSLSHRFAASSSPHAATSSFSFSRAASSKLATEVLSIRY